MSINFMILFPFVTLIFSFKGYSMFITNELNYGHLIEPDNFNISLIQPELYEIFNNVKVKFALF